MVLYGNGGGSLMGEKAQGIYKVCPQKLQPLLILWEQSMWHQCNLAAKESRLECVCVNNDNFTVQSLTVVDAIEWACVLCGHHIQNDWASRATKLQLILCEAWTFLHGNYWDDSEGCSCGQLVIGSFITTKHPLMHHLSCRVFWWDIK